MRVEEAMRHAASSCLPECSLREAAARLADLGCGVLAVATPSGRVLGVLTDRDICRWLGNAIAGAADGQARDAMRQGSLTVSRREDLGVALARMRAHGLRRLPVADGEGRLEGLVVLDDLLLRLPGTTPDDHDVLRTVHALAACGRPA